MWVLLDNYDSFTHILHHYLLLTGSECVVYRNDEISMEQLIALNPSRIIISPGPETPAQSGICMDAINYFHTSIPILGVCLGHQALGVYFGAALAHAPKPMHGKTSSIKHNEHPLFAGIDNPFTAMRYHSLIVKDFEETQLQAIAHAEDDSSIMALVHNQFPCMGIQFHPESVGSPDGQQMLNNWAKMY